MNTTLEYFLDKLYETNDRIAFSVLPEGQNIRHIRPVNKEINLSQLKKHLTTEYIKSAPGAICVCPNPLKKNTTRKRENIKYLNAVYVDIDDTEIDIEKINPAPHFVFSRTKKNHHVYWLIERLENNEENRKLFEKIEKCLIQNLGGDRAVKDISRLLRLPYTLHNKNIENSESDKRSYYRLIDAPEIPRYDLHNLAASLKIDETDNEINETEIDDPKLLNEIKKFVLASHLKRPVISQGEGRSLALYHLGADCFVWGLPKKNAYEIANRFNEEILNPPETKHVLKHQIESAYLYTRALFGEYKQHFVEQKNKAGHGNAVFRQFQNEQRIRETLRGWVFVAGAERLINMKTGFELTSMTQIDNYITFLTAQKTNLRHILRRNLIEVVEKIDFRPDIENRIHVLDDGQKLYNRFGGLRIQENDIDENEFAERVFENHIEYLTNNKIEKNTVLNYLSYIVQNPGEKLPYALLIISKFQGIGKSLLEMLLRNMYTSKTGKTYVGAIENSQLDSGFTSFIVDRLICFVHELNQGDKFHTMNKLKNLITEPFIVVNEKWAKEYTIKNTANFIMFSNSPDAIKIEKHDRRLFVVYNEKKPQDQKYYKKLVDVFQNNFDAIYQYLKNRDLSTFDPYRRPEMTAGKRQLIDQGTSELNLYLDDLSNRREGPFKFDILRVSDIQNHVDLLGPKIINGRVGQKSIKNWLIENDYHNYNIRRQINGQRKRLSVWATDNVKITDKKIESLIADDDE